MDRRDFLKTLPVISGALLTRPLGVESAMEVTAAHLPRWRGFNLLEKFVLQRNAPYREDDFAWMAEWGFDFVRLPMDYRCWTGADDPHKLDENVLKDIDQAVEFGKQYKIHVNLNLHRAPGYCVNPPKEPLDLWSSDEAVEQFCFQWKNLAERYKSLPSDRVSFDLVNEPGRIEEKDYSRVMGAAVEAIRSVNPTRLVIVDGLEWGRKPVFSLVEKKIAQSTRGYDPMRISHHRASWINGSDKWDAPEWPLKESNQVWDKDRLYQERIVPWKELEAKGVGVHVGEWGAFQRTPYEVALKWMEDCLSLWKDAGWGWSVWNLRGSFGILDSNREGAKYEDFHGRQLDRRMLELLQAY